MTGGGGTEKSHLVLFLTPLYPSHASSIKGGGVMKWY